MSAYRKLLQHIQAKDANGNLRLILVYQSFDEVDMPHGVSIRPSAIYFETADHQDVVIFQRGGVRMEESGRAPLWGKALQGQELFSYAPVLRPMSRKCAPKE